jgi:ATP-dependent 26S proteasome regulatory subunit
MVLQPYGVDKLGELSDSTPEIALDEHLYKDIEEDIKDMIENNRDKTGCLLYGKPGTGKTRLVKYFAQKFELPIYTIYLNPDYTNLDVLMLFSSIPKKCIVLLEDFDNYFDKKVCTLKNENVKFTFDSIINSLDGVYNDFNQVVFIMTANDITKIDESIKHRSSRFKFVREITAPSYNKRLELLGTDSLAKLTDGMSLDKIFFVKSIKDKYSENDILNKVNLKI